jgi:hypothetical protein
MKRSYKILIGVVALMFALGIYRTSRDWLRGYFEVTSYPVGQWEDGTWSVPLNRTVYRVYPKERRAIYWMPGVIDAPSPLVDCIIKDRCNWTCSYPEHEGEVQMGACLEENMDYELLRPVSGFVWWKYHLGWE